jgi:uncharacterized membrane protein HdeD (DUF308 family)/polyhydroxyalkanoate synthesis regulator phasin
MAEATWLEEAKKNSGFLIFLGVLTVVFGVVAIGSPLITGVAVAVFVGFLLLGSGVARIVHAFKSKQWGTGFWGTVIGLLGVVAGLLMIFRPLVGLVTMTMLLAIYFLIDGISEIVAAFKIKPDQGWGWVLFNGIIAVLLGFMIWRQWPVSGAWAIGLLVGIHILMTGWSMIILGSGARRVAGAIEDAVEDAVEAAGDVAEKAADIAEDAVDKAKDMAEDAADAAEDMVDKAKDFAGDVADKTEDVVDDVVDKAKDTFGGDKD